MYYIDLPNSVRLKIYDYDREYYKCYTELADVIFERTVEKCIENDGKVYFLEFKDDLNYEEDEDIPIEELTPIVTRRCDLDLDTEELKELKEIAKEDIKLSQIHLSQKLIDKLIKK